MINIRKLKNGLPVVLEVMPQYRSASIGIYVKVGSAYENEKNNGISHVIEHMVFKGTEKRTAKELADEIAEIGGDVNAYTTKECTCYYATVLDENLFQAMELLGDMLTYSTFNKEDLEKEKKVILDEIDLYDDSPEDVVHEYLHKQVWNSHPLGYLISGEKSVVEGFSSEDVVAFMKQYYVAGNMVISVAGNFEEEGVFSKLEDIFSSIPVGASMKEQIEPKFHKVCLFEQRQLEQVHLCLAYQGLSYEREERYIFSVVNSVLGGNMNSRLFQILREDKGLTYSVYSYGCSYEKAGLIQIYASCQPTQASKVAKGILSIIDELVEHGVTREEFYKSKKLIRSEMILSKESPESHMSYNGKSLLFRGEIPSLSQSLEKLEAVTIEEVNQFIKDYFYKKEVSFSIVGSKKAVPMKEIKELWGRKNC
ncbi:MAG: pitrilysin family protein [Lachnospiraceae bacterium]|nr:pitrilysin family protein [Lachnospiraceae bacterium]